ncbi:matrix metalloproteinase-18-like [Liolophura sinensis]|uniref:matrix metalloproteinase-18-like n=1 Tax=Liolophura sinensis TaxID=3198878 RepID=UPI0031589932
MNGAKRRLLMLILSFVGWSSNPALAKTCFQDVRRPTTPFEAQDYLLRYGYLSAQDLWRSFSRQALQESLKVFQEMAHINQTGVLDAPTYHMMQIERCGNLDISDGTSFTSDLPDHDRPLFPSAAQRRKKRFARQETQWQKQHLTYRIMNYTPDLSRDQVDQTIAAAFKVWSDVTPLTFTPSTCSPVDIEIRFASGDHGDGNPFDGQWGVLGHAYYPYDNSMDWHGDAHFDEAENWILDYSDDGSPDKFDPNEPLPITNCRMADQPASPAEPTSTPLTAATEPDTSTETSSTTQTTSGLKSTTTQTTSSTTFSPTTSSTAASTSSSPATSSTTASTSSSPTTSSTTASTSSSPTTSSTTASTSSSPTTLQHVPADELPWTSHAPCSGSVDAITLAVDGRTYAFRGKMIFCFNTYGVETGFPKPINTVFPRAPTTVDAAMTLRLPGKHSSERTFLISGSYVWRYRAEWVSRYTPELQLDWDFPRTLYEEFNVYSDKINAAFTAGGKYSDRAYLVEDDYYWEIKFDKKGKTKAKKNHIHKSKILDSLPRLDAVFHNDVIAKTYFFSGQTYYRQSSHRRGTLYGPRDTGPSWFGCQDNQQASKNW